MGPLRRRLRLAHDEGMTLVEVMVAMFIFALVSSGVIYTMLSVMTVGRDSRARQVASNLAAEAVDRAREEQDLFDLLDTSYTRELNGDTFVVSRSTAWVSDPEADFDCGSGGDQLRYKRVNIEVSWQNMREGSQPVRTDTIIDPKTRINDPLKGTLLISVINGEGEGTPGVSVTAQPTVGGSPSGSPLPAVTTDAQGCAFILRAEPGNYQVSISKPNHRDVSNVANPSTSTAVAAGGIASVAFSYDRMASFQLTFAEGAVPAPTVARTMPTTFVSTYGAIEPPVTGTGNPRSFTAFPFASGYEVLPGRYRPANIEDANSGCLSPDPAAWPGGVREPAIGAGPGETVAGAVQLGIVELEVGPVSNSSNRFIRAVSAAAPPAGTSDPGCNVGYQFIFNPAPLNAAGEAVIALPYGSWELYRGSSSNPSTRITAAQIAPLTMGSVTGTSDAVVTLDPRSS